MDELAKLQTEALDNYFIALSQFGYKNYDDVYKLLALLFLEELLTDFRGFVTEDDIRTISRVIYCLCGTTCLIDFPEYYDKVEEVEPFIAPPIKFTDFEYQRKGLNMNVSAYNIDLAEVVSKDNLILNYREVPPRNELYPALGIPSYIMRVKTKSNKFQIKYQAMVQDNIFERHYIDLIPTIDKAGDYKVPIVSSTQNIITLQLYIFSYDNSPISIQIRGIG